MCDIDNLMLYLTDMGQYSLLTEDETLKLISLAQNGDKVAKKKIIESNLKIVVYFAKRYQTNSMDILDLIQEGNIGLMKAITKFDANKGIKFSTYAGYLINYEILRAIDNKDNIIKIPANFCYLIRKYNKLQIQYLKQYGKRLNSYEISKLMNIDEEQIEFILKIKGLLSIYSYDEVDIICDELDDSISFEPIIDNISDDQDLFEEYTYSDILKSEIISLLSTLNKKQRQIIEKRYGINGEIKTLEAIGKEFGTSKQWIQESEKTILQKLYSTSKRRKLREFLN